MADDPNIGAAPAVSSAAPVNSPVSAVTTSPAPVLTPTEPAVGSNTAAPVAAVPSVSTPAEPPPSILSEAKPAPAVEKPAEAAPATTPPPTTEAPAVVSPPVFEAFKLPDGVTLDEAKLGEVNTALGKLVTENKVPQEAAQALGQQMVDMHIAELQNHLKRQDENFRQIRQSWVDAFKADPKIGGEHTEATISACGQMIEQFGGDAAQQAELRKMFRITGMGDHPGLIRLLANAAKALGEGGPVPATIPRSLPPMTRGQRRYGTSLAKPNGAS